MQRLRTNTFHDKSSVAAGLIAFLLVVVIIAGLLIPHKDLATLYLNIIVTIGVLTAIPGVYIALARQFGLWLPAFLQVPEKSRDQNWRLVALSLAAIVFPLLVLMIYYALFH